MKTEDKIEALIKLCWKTGEEKNVAWCRSIDGEYREFATPALRNWYLNDKARECLRSRDTIVTLVIEYCCSTSEGPWRRFFKHLVHAADTEGLPRDMSIFMSNAECIADALLKAADLWKKE